MNLVPAGLTEKVTRTFARQILVTQKNSPSILFGVGVVGAVTATVLACRATLKLENVVIETEEMINKANTLQHATYSEEDRVQDKVIIYTRSFGSIVKLYAPAVVVGVLSIAALTKSHQILMNRNNALATAYIALEKGFKEYRRRVTEEFGEEKDQELRYGKETREVAVDTPKGTKIQKVTHVGKDSPSMYAKMFDARNKNWQRQAEYNFLFLNGVQNYHNDLLQARGHVMLNDVYDALGFERTPAGTQVGWVWEGDGDNYIDFGFRDKVDLQKFRDFVQGREGELLLDFNVDGLIWKKI